MTTLRLIHDPPGEGAWNMAVDEMMLHRAASSGRPILRFYSWREPTLSLGYFQTLEDRQQHEPSLQCPVVRRSTGGGAILHDHEITYSIAVPLRDRWSQFAADLYDAFHAGLVAALARFDIKAELCEATFHPLEGEPFLCFQRRAKGDVLVGSLKIAGSAQRRHRSALVQHGSVLLQRSESAPELPGLRDLAPQLPAVDDFLRLWTREAVTRCLSLPIDQENGWNQAEIAQAGEICTSRFSTDHWLRRRSGT